MKSVLCKILCKVKTLNKTIHLTHLPSRAASYNLTVCLKQQTYIWLLYQHDTAPMSRRKTLKFKEKDICMKGYNSPWEFGLDCFAGNNYMLFYSTIFSPLFERYIIFCFIKFKCLVIVGEIMYRGAESIILSRVQVNRCELQAGHGAAEKHISRYL